MKYVRYPEYKDSGIEWLDEVPVHWKIHSLKRGYVVNLGKMLQPEPRLGSSTFHMDFSMEPAGLAIM